MVRWLSCCCLAFSLLAALVYAQPPGSDNWKKEDQARTSAADLKVPTIDPRGGRSRNSQGHTIARKTQRYANGAMRRIGMF